MPLRSTPTTTATWRGHLPLLFTDLCDYTVLGEQCDPEDVRALRGKLEQLAEAALRRHGGSMTQCYGDGILAVFGLPVAQEHAARSAIDTAIELHNQVRSTDWSDFVPAGFEVRVHTGIHSGLLVARDGDSLHGRYDLTGDAVNTAARLCAAAGRDQILASKAVLQGVEGFYETRPLSPGLTLKGKQERIEAFQVLKRCGPRTRLDAQRRRGRTSFVGREAELSRLTQGVQRARHGRGQVLFVVGEAGVGKSRLLEELRTRLERESLRVLVGSCENHRELAPLEPFRQALEQLLGVAAGSPSALAGVEGRLQKLRVSDRAASCLAQLWTDPICELGGQGEGDALLAASWRELLRAAGSDRPVVLILDDWHWSDDSSRKALAQVAQDPGACCVIVSTRALEASHQLIPNHEIIRLANLCEQQSTAVVHAMRPEVVSPGTARTLHQLSGGNPLFLEELCRALSDAPMEVDQLHRGSIPISIHGVIQTRLAALPPAHIGILGAASVLGIDFSIARLSRIAPAQDLTGILEELVDHGLIYPTGATGGFRFKHGVTREVIYESLLKDERRRLHGIAAQLILQSSSDEALHTQVEALAHHLRGSRNHERAAEFAERAGDKAMVTLTFDRARMHYEAALDELEQLPPSEERKLAWLRVSIRWTNTCVYSPARNQIPRLERAARYADEIGETGARAQARYSLGWVHYALGDFAAAVAHDQLALELASSARAARLEEQLWANLGQSYAAAGRYTEALAYLNRSIERKRGRGPRRPGQVAQGFAYALGCRAAVYSDMGDEAQAAQDIREALAAAGEAEHAVRGSVLALQAMTAIHREAWPECEAASQQACAVAARTNSAYVLATATVYQTYAQWKLTQQPEALSRLQQAIDWLEAHGLGLFISLAYGCLADGLCDASAREAAERAAHKALARAQHEDPLGEGMACRTLARLQAACAAAGETSGQWLVRARDSASRRASRRELLWTDRLAAQIRRIQK